MGKGLFCVALTACLLASAQPFIIGSDLLAPITGVVNGLANSVGVMASAGVNVTAGLTGSLGALTGVVQDATGTVTNLAGSLTSSVNSLVKPALQIVNVLPGTVGGLTTALNVEGLAGTVGKTLQTAVAVPSNVVSGLSASISGSLNPAKLIADITGALKPTLDALTSVTKQLTGTGAAGCLLNSATGLIKGSVLTSVGEILTCATPVNNAVKDLTKDVTNITRNSIDFANQVLLKATNCIQQSATSANIGGIVSCVVDPVTQSATLVTNTITDATPLVSKTLSSTLQVPTCASTVLTNALKKNTELLQSIVQCAAGKGVNVSLPNIPSLLPNFTAIANKAVSAIEDIVKSAVGPNSPVNNLLQTLEQLKSLATTLTPNALNAVNTTIQSVQEIINLATKVAGGNLKALTCVKDAQNVLTDLAPEAVNNVVSCTVNLTKDTASLASQAVAFDIGLKLDLIGAGANALAKCFLSISSLGDAVEKCFDAAVSEVQNYVKGQLSKINNAVDTAQSLTGNAQNCLNNVLNRTTAIGQLIVAKQKACLAEQSITLPTNDITSVLVAGKAGIEKLVLSLSGALNNVSSTSANVQASVDFIASINKTALESVIKGQISTSQNAVLQVEVALKDNTNPAVKTCIDSAKDKLSKLEEGAVTSALNCVAPLKEQISALAAQAVAEDLALKGKLANVVIKADQQCSTSVSAAVAQQCFVDVEVNLNADVQQTVQRAQQVSNNAAQLVADAGKCVSDNAVKAVEAELAALSSCLAAQGIKVQFVRS